MKPTRPDTNHWRALLAGFVLLINSACGGGGGSSDATSLQAPAPAPDCADCGVVYVGLTDAEGDFLQYELDVLSLTLTRADGLVVETLPLTTRVDFAKYVDLTEFVTAATVPPGVYVSSTITLNYDNAVVVVEKGGQPVGAELRNSNGLPPGTVTATMDMVGSEMLRITRGLPGWITLDFDLDASNTVDTTLSPPLVIAQPVLIADPDLLDEKERRARGPLIDVDPSTSHFTIALRPFRRAAGDFGRLQVATDAETRFEIDGESYRGDTGLRALEAAGAGTPTLTLGVMHRQGRVFQAQQVFAGDSVPGVRYDAARGVVVARDGDELTLHGVALERIAGGAAFYRHRISVQLGPDTLVYKHRGDDGILDTDAISPGQRVRVLGQLTEPADGPPVLDARIVRMLRSTAAGTVNLDEPGYLSMSLQHLSGRPVAMFDFAGTGISPEFDADPADYEINTGELNSIMQTSGSPVVALGYPAPFGTAPADFDARSVADFSQTRARLGFGWIDPGSANPFLRIDEAGLVINDQDPALGERHHVLRAGIVSDALSAGIPPTIIPRTGSRGLYAIAGAGQPARRIAVYYDFAAFADALAIVLDGSVYVRHLHGAGHWDDASATLEATRLTVVIGH
ncbi:MAG: metallophosphoesterase [Gammaproteobacteria bacterium]